MKTYTCIGDGSGEGCEETNLTSAGLMLKHGETGEDVFICEQCAEDELEHVPN